LSLGEHLRLGEGELKSGGFRRPSILADAFEALIGAILLDGGFESAEQVLGRLYQPLLAATDPTALGKDPKTRLQEYLQAKRLALPQYVIVTVSGEAHEQHFRVECTVPELGVRAYGEGASRRAAEQEAARSAYELAAESK
jgi:ribonuclease-3